MPITVVRRDITKIKADAIVSASGHSFASHGAVSSAIFEAAGPQLQAECDKTGALDTGKVLVTGAYDLPADFVVHTVGPEWRDGHCGEELLLSACYQKCLAAAWEKGCRSIAFPLISSGGYGFPKEHALKTAMDAIAVYEHFGEMDVTLAVYDRNSYEVSKDLLKDISEYMNGLDEVAFAYGGGPLEPDGFSPEKGFFVAERHREFGRRELRREERRHRDLSRRDSLECAFPEELDKSSAPKYKNEEIRPKDAASVPQGVIDALKYRDENFREMLIRLMNEKNLENTDVYKRANVSRAVFSNIISKPEYRAKKGTALALAVALKLDLDDTKEFIAKAGHALSHSFKQDVIVEYFIVHGKYDVFELNEVLFALDLPRLGEKNE